MDALPEQFRTVVLLADVEGFTCKEIAEAMGVPVGTVTSQLHRGRRRLRASLGDYAHARGLAGPPAATDAAPGRRRVGAP